MLMFSLVNNCFSVASLAEEVGVLLSENLCAILLMVRQCSKRHKRQKKLKKQTATGHERTLGKLYFLVPEPVLSEADGKTCFIIAAFECC